MFILNAVFTPLFWLFSPSSLLKSMAKWWNYGKKSFTQR
jgi:hypothetical protein